MISNPGLRLSMAWSLCLAGCWAAADEPAVAAEQVADAGPPMAFSIPPQPLADALSAYGEATHRPLFVDSALTAGRRSAAVVGMDRPAEALRKMLAGTGLAAQALGADGFTLVPERPPTAEDAGRSAGRAAPPAAAPIVAGDYSAAIQSALRQALCRRDEIRPGTFRALIRLWVGASGQVARSQLLTSTGDGRRDRSLQQTLDTLSIAPAPPSNLSLPVTILLAAGEADCPPDQAELRRADADGDRP